MNNSELCKSCENVGECSEYLRPTNIGGGCPLTTISCRHYTCPLGMREARSAVKLHLAKNWKMLHPVAFGSSHKPIGTRLVDVDGNILSEQDGKMYPTGQFVSISMIMLMIEQ